MRLEAISRDVWTVRWWLRLIVFAALAGALLGVLGPFGSYLNGHWPVLVMHWIVMTTLGAGLFGLVLPPLVRLAVRRGVPGFAALPATVATVAVPLSALSALEAGWLWPKQTAHLRPLDWYVQALLISLCLTATWLLIEFVRQARRQPAPTATVAPPQISSSKEPVVCLQMEDHYVRVHRTSGSTLELMPLQDAITRYGRDGLQVHRSWWVARRAVTRAERDGRNWRLRLSNDLLVPVARNRVVEARAMGLIDPRWPEPEQ